MNIVKEKQHSNAQYEGKVRDVPLFVKYAYVWIDLRQLRERILISNEIFSSPFPSKGDYMHSFVCSVSIYWAFPLCQALAREGIQCRGKERKGLQNMITDGYLGLEILWLNWQWSVFSYLFLFYLLFMSCNSQWGTPSSCLCEPVLCFERWRKTWNLKVIYQFLWIADVFPAAISIGCLFCFFKVQTSFWIAGRRSIWLQHTDIE